MKSKLLILSILAFSLFFSQTILAQFVKGNGNVTKSNRQISGIKYVKVEDGIDLYLYMNGNEKLGIEADENLHDLIRTEKDGDKLHIYLSKSVRKAKSLKVHLSVLDLKGVKASGGSDVDSRDLIKVDNLNLVCSGGSDIKMQVEANELKCKTSGGSDSYLSGKVKIFRAEASGGSDVQAFKLESEECYVEVSGGSDANVYATKKLHVRASGGSDVSYKGNPQPINANMSGGSDLHHQ